MRLDSGNNRAFFLRSLFGQELLNQYLLSSFNPNPSHSGQAPVGALKENNRGSNSPTVNPQMGQAYCSENGIGSPQSHQQLHNHRLSGELIQRSQIAAT